MSFDPEKVERHNFEWELQGVEGWNKRWIEAADYDQLLAMYRKLRDRQ